MEAQHDAMSLTAQQQLSITSTEDEIIITTPKKLTLNGGGSYLTLDANRIEHGSGGDFTMKCAHYQVPMTGNSLSSNTPEFTVSTLKLEKDAGKGFSG
jgi:type VI secretion system secreted protein VgrG